jgi:predicted homoserine dehydrogenase-like protein
MPYGEAVNSDDMRNNQYLPEGLVEGCRLKRDIRKDDVLTYDDVDLPPGRLADKRRGSSTPTSRKAEPRSARPRADPDEPELGRPAARASP